MGKIILYTTKESCCGCFACYSVCPFSAIEMKFDEEGFIYPFINYDKCGKCRKCISVCSFKVDLKKRKVNLSEEIK